MTHELDTDRMLYELRELEALASGVAVPPPAISVAPEPIPSAETLLESSGIENPGGEEMIVALWEQAKGRGESKKQFASQVIGWVEEDQRLSEFNRMLRRVRRLKKR